MAYTNLLYCSDRTGTGVWRLLMPHLALSYDREIDTTVISNRIILDQNYYQHMNMIMFQRVVSDQSKAIFQQVLIPAAQRFGIWLIANIDDCLHPDEIPTYNMGRKAYLNPTAVSNIKFSLDNAGMIIVTTDHLKEYYCKKFLQDPDKIIKIPNYLPEFWFANKYNEQKVWDNWNENKKRPRIGVISSTSHYNLDPNNPEKDDLDLILDLVKSTLHDFQWVFLGHLHHKIKLYVDKGLIEHHHGVDIYNYPNKLYNLNLNCIVAPLLKNTFNLCKSNIKILEASALGIPFFVQDIDNYSKYTHHTFSDQNDLANKLFELSKSTRYAVRDIVRDNYAKLNTQHDEGNTWWLGPNLHTWQNIFKIRQRAVNINMQGYLEYLKNKQEKTNAQ